MRWQIRQAKQGFSQLVRRAVEEGPQVVTKHGEDVVVVLSAKEYQRLKGEANVGFYHFLMSGPDLSLLEIHRSKEPSRRVEL